MKIYFECASFEDKHKLYELFNIVVPSIHQNFTYGMLGDSNDNRNREVELLEIDITEVTARDVRKLTNALEYFQAHVATKGEEE